MAALLPTIPLLTEARFTTLVSASSLNTLLLTLLLRASRTSSPNFSAKAMLFSMSRTLRAKAQTAPQFVRASFPTAMTLSLQTLHLHFRLPLPQQTLSLFSELPLPTTAQRLTSPTGQAQQEQTSRVQLTLLLSTSRKRCSRSSSPMLSR